MSNIIMLFDGSPRLSNNILPKPNYNLTKSLVLSDALTKRRIERQMKNDTNLTPEDIEVLKIIVIPALQIEQSLLERICHVY